MQTKKQFGIVDIFKAILQSVAYGVNVLTKVFFKYGSSTDLLYVLGTNNYTHVIITNHYFQYMSLDGAT